MVDQWLSDCGPRYVNLSTAACELHAGLSLDLRLSHRSMKDAVYLYMYKCVCLCVCVCVCTSLLQISLPIAYTHLSSPFAILPVILQTKLDKKKMDPEKMKKAEQLAREIEKERARGISAVSAAAMDLEITGDDDAWASDVHRVDTSKQ